MKLSFQFKKAVFSLVATLVLVVVSIYVLDLPLAAWFAERQWSYSLRAAAVKMPELSSIVVTLASLGWIAYLFLVSQNTSRSTRSFCLITAITLPLSFGVKVVLKWVFGRTETLNWLTQSHPDSFHWFAGKAGYLSFPSGHMLVLTPLILALWHFYPRYRVYYGIVWCCLGAALTATSEHFLSDVLAGAYFGSIIYLATSRAIEAFDSRMPRLLMATYRQ